MRWVELHNALIKDDLDLSGGKCVGRLSLINCLLCGDLTIKDASLGTLILSGSCVSRINGDNVKVAGSLRFGGGFVANGQVSLVGAEISKDLDFSDSAFHNDSKSRFAILADRSKVSGVVKFQTTDAISGGHSFQSFGAVSLRGAECGGLYCDGGTFRDPEWMALDCDEINVKGSVSLCNLGVRPFKARGLVSFRTAQIGKHLYCGGGRFYNPGGVALNCEAAKIAGCVFLGLCEDYPGVVAMDRPDLAFWSIGRVNS